MCGFKQNVRGSGAVRAYDFNAQLEISTIADNVLISNVTIVGVQRNKMTTINA